MNPKEILKNNYNASNQSFIYYLHEESRFDKDKFWEYYYALIHLDKNLELMKEVHFTYRYILESFIYHFDTTDLYRIKHFPRKKYTFYLERLRYAVEAYINRATYDEAIFGNELRPPKWFLKQSFKINSSENDVPSLE